MGMRAAEVTLSFLSRALGSFVVVVALAQSSTAEARTATRAPRVLTYRIATTGKISADRTEFAQQVAETLEDDRGWVSAGVVFRRVTKGGDFTIWLASAPRVPTFGKPCTITYSCRVGRNVIINQDRWTHGTKSWFVSESTLREYRHLIVNHEVGHWLGLQHRTCTTMQQQSINLGGCTANAWPLDSELAIARRKFR
jgi:Protein of unknown function (DUF3152)